ncbi:MAG: hypothetical protein H6613_13445 [Ignavibacteriales bacterium]|nr:hypothetical protein [Ignavibacteriales bacterium]
MIQQEDFIKNKIGGEQMPIKKQFSIINHLNTTEVRYVNPGAQYDDELEIKENHIVRKTKLDKNSLIERMSKTKKNIDDIN